MLDINEELKRKIIEINSELNKKYRFLDNKGKNVLEKLKCSTGLIIRHMRKIMEHEVGELSKNKGIIGVDGSINTIGSSFPHYISIMQALAKCTDRKYQDIVLADIHTPMLNDKQFLFVDERLSEQDRDEKEKAAKMAILELEAAVKALDEMDASIIMMDGSLIRYKIYCGALWDEFVEKALKKGIYVIGVIEEIKTKDLSQYLGDLLPEGVILHDRELLFGILEEGQMIIMKDIKTDRGLKKCFMRTSRDPHVIGMDVLEEQQDMIEPLADLVYTLTQEGSRGIPLWLDIVDSEVKITNKLVDSLVNTYIDEANRRRFFVAKRDNRTL